MKDTTKRTVVNALYGTLYIAWVLFAIYLLFVEGRESLGFIATVSVIMALLALTRWALGLAKNSKR